MPFFYPSSSTAELPPLPVSSRGPGASGRGTREVVREQCQQVAERHAHLQGLRIVPLGLLFLVSAVWRAGYLPWPAAVHTARVTFFAALVVAVGVSFPIRAAYWRHSGRPRVRRHRTGAMTLILVTAAFLLSTALPSTPRSPSMPALVVGLALIYPAMFVGGRRWHYLPLAAAWGLFALLRTFGVSFHVREVTLDLLIAISVIVAGLGDHRLWRRTYTSRQDADAPLS
jgi:uncharacterized membrane protein YhaH (DUF805 family)